VVANVEEVRGTGMDSIAEERAEEGGRGRAGFAAGRGAAEGMGREGGRESIGARIAGIGIRGTERQTEKASRSKKNTETKRKE
jgi:hypothetical protein